MKPISRLAENLPRSGIREVMDLAANIEGVIHLEVGEPSFNTPAHIIDAAMADAHRGFTKYTSSVGFKSLREAIAQRASARFGRPVGADQVMVASGGVCAMAVAMMTLVEEGEEVLLPDPTWPHYVNQVALLRAKVLRYRLDPAKDYVPDPREIAALATDRTKVLLVNNPGNPTGGVLPASAVEELVGIAREKDLYLISDEIYEDLVFDAPFVPAGRYDDERVITVSGASKSYAMTGWRLGYVIAPARLIPTMAKVQEPLTSCAPAVSQRAYEAALRGPQDCVEEMRLTYQRRRDLVRDLLGPAGLLPSVPRGAFYAMVNLRCTGMDSRALSRGLIREEKVATAPGSTFGPSAEGMVRISLATDDAQLAEGCRRIISFADRHRVP